MAHKQSYSRTRPSSTEAGLINFSKLPIGFNLISHYDGQRSFTSSGCVDIRLVSAYGIQLLTPAFWGHNKNLDFLFLAYHYCSCVNYACNGRYHRGLLKRGWIGHSDENHVGGGMTTDERIT